MTKKNKPLMRIDPELESVLKQAGKPYTENSKLLAKIVRENGSWRLIEKRKKMKKKGTVLDMLPVLVTTLVFSVMVLLGYTLISAFANGPFVGTAGQSYVQGFQQNYVVFDNLFIAVLIGLSLTSVVSAAFVRTSPLFFVLSIILLGITLLGAVIVSNTFAAITSANAFAGYDQVFTKMYFIMDNLLLYALVMAGLIMLSLYSVRGSNV